MDDDDKVFAVAVDDDRDGDKGNAVGIVTTEDVDKVFAVEDD